jgi:hypothetical protein
MRFGVREICEVVLKAKANQKVGDKYFYKHEPVIYFDSLKTSTMEGAATTVYAQGGRGNSRLIAWEGERTITFTMEDALLSPVSFSILSGAGLLDATGTDTIKVHQVEQTNEVDVTDGVVTITLEEIPYLGEYDTEKGKYGDEDYVYVMLLKDGEVISEPYLADKTKYTQDSTTITLKSTDDLGKFVTDCTVLVDYYTEKATGAQQIEITPDKFGGNYYLEASTLFRDTNGVDLPAEFVIPNCKIQSNFTFTMASSGDPSTFTFTMDAFPDYTRFDKTKKVLAAIQILTAAVTTETTRDKTKSVGFERT